MANANQPVSEALSDKILAAYAARDKAIEKANDACSKVLNDLLADCKSGFTLQIGGKWYKVRNKREGAGKTLTDIDDEVRKYAALAGGAANDNGSV